MNQPETPSIIVRWASLSHPNEHIQEMETWISERYAVDVNLLAHNTSKIFQEARFAGARLYDFLPAIINIVAKYPNNPKKNCTNGCSSILYWFKICLSVDTISKLYTSVFIQSLSLHFEQMFNLLYQDLYFGLISQLGDIVESGTCIGPASKHLEDHRHS